jgi:hypothetical protein
MHPWMSPETGPSGAEQESTMNRNSKILAAASSAAMTVLVAGISTAHAEGYRYRNDMPRDHDRGIHHRLPRVSAEGAAPSWWAARMEAVHNWRDKVADRYGYQYSKWWSARDKDVECRKFADDDPVWDRYGKRSLERARPRHYEPVTRCVVSAIPSRGWGGYFGYYGR